MNWQEATDLIRQGRKVRRSIWETALRRMRPFGRIEWDITVTLARKCNDDKSSDRRYEPTLIDMLATDWEEVVPMWTKHRRSKPNYEETPMEWA